MTFFTNGNYEIIPVLTTVTASEMVEAPEISFHKNIMGMGNAGVFLKDSNSEDGKKAVNLRTALYVSLEKYNFVPWSSLRNIVGIISYKFVP